jgi:hypothetical protein
LAQVNQHATIRQGTGMLSNYIGVGGGTVIVSIAKSIPDTYWLKPYILLAIPTISIGLLNLTNVFDALCRALNMQLKKSVLNRQLQRKLRLIDEDPDITVEEIDDLKKQVARAKINQVEHILERLRQLH